MYAVRYVPKHCSDKCRDVPNRVSTVLTHLRTAIAKVLNVVDNHEVLELLLHAHISSDFENLCPVEDEDMSCKSMC